MLTTIKVPLTKGDHYVERYAIRDSASGLLMRDTGNDQGNFQVANELLARVSVKGHRVLDIGAAIGIFAYECVKKEADAIRAVEPDWSRFQVLKINAKPFKQIVPLRMLLGPGTTAGEATFHVEGEYSKQKNLATMPLTGIVQSFRPTIVKIPAQVLVSGGWTHALPPAVRITLVKCRGLSGVSHDIMDRLRKLMPGMRLTERVQIRGNEWLVWRR